MYLTKREKTIKYAIFALVTVVGALLQNVGGLWFEIGNARCFFLIPIAILLGIDEDERVSALLGLFAGLLWDTVSVQHMGYNAVFLMLVCYITSSLVTYLLVSTFWVKTICCLIAELLYVLIYWILFVVIKGGDGAILSLGYFYIPCFIYTGVITLILTSVLDKIVRRLNREPNMD